ncbi:MAG TPA: hypothetical protein VHB21_05395, partial [Minicystis sp.]|nr:hypothetical protein [Minicystis sp.]
AALGLPFSNVLARSFDIPAAWSAAVHRSPRRVYLAHAEFTPDGEPLHRQLDSGARRVLELSGADCGTTECYLLVEVPLVRGETFELTSRDLPRATTASSSTPWGDAGPDVPWKSAAPRGRNLYRYLPRAQAGEIELTAPFSGWYVVRATLPAMRRDARAAGRLDVEVRITKPARAG